MDKETLEFYAALTMYAQTGMYVMKYIGYHIIQNTVKGRGTLAEQHVKDEMNAIKKMFCLPTPLDLISIYTLLFRKLKKYRNDAGSELESKLESIESKQR